MKLNKCIRFFSLLLRFSALLLLPLLISFPMCFHLNVFACVPLNWFENDEANEQSVCCCWYALAIDRTNYSFIHSAQCAHTQPMTNLMCHSFVEFLQIVFKKWNEMAFSTNAIQFPFLVTFLLLFFSFFFLYGVFCMWYLQHCAVCTMHIATIC